MPPARDLTGYRPGMLVAVETTTKRKCGHIVWSVRCDCGNQAEATLGDLTRKDARRKKSCGCMNWRRSARSSNWKGVGEMGSTHWSSIKSQAAVRGYSLQITHEDVWGLYLAQDRRCALSGLEIGFAKSKYGDTTASLDRIDSALGYTLQNVQWVHKDVNMMKRTYTQARFIEVCRLVADLHVTNVRSSGSAP